MGAGAEQPPEPQERQEAQEQQSHEDEGGEAPAPLPGPTVPPCAL